MARLVEAVRPEARLVLVGDPGQLTSIEAGAVLGDIVAAAEATSAADGIVVLDRVHRYGGAIARVAEAIRRGDADAVVEALAGGDMDPGRRRRPRRRRRSARCTTAAVASARAVVGGGRGRRGRGGASRRSARSACSARTGAAPHGVTAWTSRIEGWLATRSPASAPRRTGTSAARCS